MSMTNRIARVLLIEDVDDLADLVRRSLDMPNDGDIHCEHVKEIGTGLDYLERQAVDAVLLNVDLPDAPGVSPVAHV